MPCGVEPKQKCRILTVQIAVPADAPEGEIADEMSNILTGALCSTDSNILDWQYVTPIKRSRIVAVGEDIEEGEVFTLKEYYGE